MCSFFSDTSRTKKPPNVNLLFIQILDHRYFSSLGRNVSHLLSLKFSHPLLLIREVLVRTAGTFFCFTVFQQVEKKKGERNKKKEGRRVGECRRQRKDEKGSWRENEKREV